MGEIHKTDVGCGFRKEILSLGPEYMVHKPSFYLYKNFTNTIVKSMSSWSSLVISWFKEAKRIHKRERMGGFLVVNYNFLGFSCGYYCACISNNCVASWDYFDNSIDSS